MRLDFNGLTDFHRKIRIGCLTPVSWWVPKQGEGAGTIKMCVPVLERPNEKTAYDRAQ